MPEFDYNSRSGRISPVVSEKAASPAGLFEHGFVSEKGESLVCVSGGVGDKLKIAFLTDKHDTVGIDCVAACVNKIICSGAPPIFFQSHISVGGENRERDKKILAGLKNGCEMAGCELLDYTVAALDGILPQNAYNLAGFCAGAVKKSQIINKTAVRDGDAVIGIASSGLHLNGFGLAAKVFDIGRRGVREYISELGSTLGDALLTPSRIYAKSILALTQTVVLRGVRSIAEGGLYGSLPLSLPEGLGVRIERSKLDVPPIFRVIQKVGYLSDREMFGEFNMGTGMCVIVAQEDTATAVRLLLSCGEKVSVIGEVKRDVHGVTVV